jgi:hypothetical protein
MKEHTKLLTEMVAYLVTKNLEDRQIIQDDGSWKLMSSQTSGHTITAVVRDGDVVCADCGERVTRQLSPPDLWEHVA